MLFEDNEVSNPAARFLFCGELLVQLHQLGDAFGFGVEPAPEAVGFHDGSVIGLVCLAQLWRHGDFVVEVS